MNKVLQSIGLQERVNGGWFATANAEGLATQRGHEVGQKFYVQWDKSIIQYLIKALQ